MSRYDLTDFEWRVIEPLLPNKPRGVPRVDDRRVLNGIFWVLCSRAPWRDLPERYGPRTTCCNRFVRWRKAGVWDRLIDAISAAHDGQIQMSTAPPFAPTSRPRRQKGGPDHCLGRSRGGLTTKIHVVVDAQGLPIRLGLTAGQTYDGKIADRLLDQLGPRTIVLADKAYDADHIRELIQNQGATPNIPPKSNRRWKPCFSKRLYRERNLIERFFSKLEHFHRVATRYDKLAANSLAMIQLAQCGCGSALMSLRPNPAADRRDAGTRRSGPRRSRVRAVRAGRRPALSRPAAPRDQAGDLDYAQEGFVDALPAAARRRLRAANTGAARCSGNGLSYPSTELLGAKRRTALPPAFTRYACAHPPPR